MPQPSITPHLLQPSILNSFFHSLSYHIHEMLANLKMKRHFLILNIYILDFRYHGLGDIYTPMQMEKAFTLHISDDL